MGRVGIIYVLVDPRCPKDVRYVGLTVDPKTRYSKHLSLSRKGGRYARSWVNSLLKAGVKPRMITLATHPEEELPDREIEWIAHYRALGARLTNATAGGDGIRNPIPELREQQKKSLDGYVDRATEDALTQYPGHTTIKLLAAELGISKQLLANAISVGMIGAIKVNSLRLISPDDAAAYREYRDQLRSGEVWAKSRAKGVATQRKNGRPLGHSPEAARKVSAALMGRKSTVPSEVHGLQTKRNLAALRERLLSEYPDHLTAPEAAEAVGWSRVRVFKAIKSGRLKAIRPKHWWLIHKDEVAAVFLVEHSQQEAPQEP